MPTVRQYNKDVSFTLVAGAALTEGQLCGVNGSGNAVLADSTAADGPIHAVGFAVRTVASGAPVAICPVGVVDGFSSLTPGARQFASGTAGGVTATRPTGAGDAIQPVGIAISTTMIAMNISPTPVLAQAAGNSTVT